MYLEIFWVILIIALILLIIFCIPILLQIWRSAKDLALTLETLNRSLPPILKNLEEITVNISNSTAAVNREVQSFSNTISRLQLILSGFVDNIEHIVPEVIKLPLFQKMKNIVAVVKGVRVFCDVYSDKK